MLNTENLDIGDFENDVDRRIIELMDSGLKIDLKDKKTLEIMRKHVYLFGGYLRILKQLEDQYYGDAE